MYSFNNFLNQEHSIIILICNVNKKEKRIVANESVRVITEGKMESLLH